MDWQSAGGTSLPSGGAEADDGEPDEWLRRLPGRGRWVPRWVPHTTPSSLPERRAWLLARADHKLASLGGRSERAGPPPAADRGGERRPDDGYDGGDGDGAVADDRRDDVPVSRPGSDVKRV